MRFRGVMAMLRKFAGPYAAGALAALLTSIVLWIAVRAKLGTLCDGGAGQALPGRARPSLAGLARTRGQLVRAGLAARPRARADPGARGPARLAIAQPA